MSALFTVEIILILMLMDYALNKFSFILETTCNPNSTKMHIKSVSQL